MSISNNKDNIKNQINYDFSLEVNNLSSILKTEEIQSLVNDFYKLTHIGISLTDIDGNILVSTGFHDICKNFHRCNEESILNCLESEKIATTDFVNGEFKLLKCKNNLWIISSPINIADYHIGNLLIGQFLLDSENHDNEFFKEQAKKYNFNEKDYLKSLNSVPRWSEETVRIAMNFYSRLSNLIVNESYKNLQLEHLLEENRKLMDDLKSSELEFLTLFQTMPTGVVYQDSKGRIIKINPAAEHMLGLSPSQIHGRTSTDPRWRTIKPDKSDFPGSEHPAMVSLKTGKPVKNNVMGVYNPVTRVYNWLLVNSVPEFKHGQKKPYRVYTNTIDITKLIDTENRLRESEEKYKIISENAADVIWMLNIENLTFDYVSPSVKKLLYYTAEEVTNMSLQDVMTKESYNIVVDNINFLLTQIKTNKISKHDVKFRIIQLKKDGTEINTEIIITLITDDNIKPSKVLIVSRNIEDTLLMEKIQDVRLELLQNSASMNPAQFLNYTINELCLLVKCPVGFLYFVNEVHTSVTLRASKPETLNINSHFWEDSLKERSVIIINDFEKYLEEKNLPANNTEFKRFVSLPIIRKNKVVAIFGVANKNTNFSENDVKVLNRIADLAWDISEIKLVEKAMRESEERLRVLINTLPDLICFKDAEGKWLLANESLLNLFGLKGVDYTGKTEKELAQFSTIITEEKIKSWSDSDNYTWESKEITRSENILYYSNQKPHYYEVTKIPLYNDDGSRRGIVVTGNDITQRKKDNENIRKLSKAIEQSPVSIVITNTDGSIEYVNPRFTEITGYTLDEAINKNPRILKSNITPVDTYSNLWLEISKGKTWKGEFINKKKSGELFVEEAIISPMLDGEGNITHYIAIKEDISERKKIEEELIKAKERAEEMNRVKNYFFANMSHELRTPMVGILGFSELLMDLSPEGEVKKMAEIINGSSKRLMDTLNMILNLAKIEAERHEVNLTKINLKDIANEVTLLFKPQANKKKIALITEYPDYDIIMISDEKILVQIFNNLINNAIKYTNKGFVKLILRKDIIDEKEKVIIKVIDTGIGIPEEKQKIIWEEFRQVSEGVSRTHDGTGLGLTLTKRFVEILNGKITLESNIYKGTIFTIEFPLETISGDIPFKKEIKKEIMNQNSNTPVIHKPSLLYVENDFESRQLVKALVKNNYEIDFAVNGDETLTKVHDTEKKYDIILMDVNLGKGFDGFQLTKMIKKNDRYKNVPVIAVTAYAMYSDKEEALASGCTDYISKPFTRNEFLEILKKYTKEQV